MYDDDEEDGLVEFDYTPQPDSDFSVKMEKKIFFIIFLNKKIKKKFFPNFFFFNNFLKIGIKFNKKI